MRAGIWLLALLCLGCDDAGTRASRPLPGEFSPFLPEAGPRLVPRPARAVHRGWPKVPIWQPGFHQALRWSESFDRPITLRLRVPSSRAGERLVLAFRTGDGPGILHGASVARADGEGRLASPAQPLAFAGEPGFSAGPRERRLSDPLPFAVARGEELYVTLEIEGHFAAGYIDLFPDSWAARDLRVDDPEVDSWEEERAIGLQSILVEGEEGRALVAIGDSITEAYVDGRHDDYRKSWAAIAADRLGLPLANAAVSGQGLLATRENLAGEVLLLPGITDCLLLIGTNDLGSVDEAWLERMLGGLIDDLRPFCTVWAGTLPPKDRPGLPQRVERLRDFLNGWIREEAQVEGVIDFEAVLQHPDDEDRFGPDLGEDGVHPSHEGQRLMGEEAARYLREMFEKR